MALNKLYNEYASAIGAELYDAAPKAVLAAIAVSALTGGGARLTEAPALILAEWRVLHQNGIVPQRPLPRPREGKNGRGVRP